LFTIHHFIDKFLNGFASTSFKIKTHDLKSSQEADIKAISLFIKTAFEALRAAGFLSVRLSSQTG
jgi:hypothetical protein